MAYSGRYKPKNTNKYVGDYTNIVYRSLWEKHVFNWCDQNPKVKSWSSEEIIVPYYYEVDKRYHRYFPDIKIVMEDKILLVEIKPEKETVLPTSPKRTKQYINESLTYIKNMNKWEAANSFCKDRGWDFQIWTEKTLQEMKLLPKPVPGKLKPLKRLKPFRKKRRK
tara:strand:+ start:503 stop:1000 length:498 start_codon:yes stop_codon:yes gene_type:complete